MKWFVYHVTLLVTEHQFPGNKLWYFLPLFPWLFCRKCDRHVQFLKYIQLLMNCYQFWVGILWAVAATVFLKKKLIPGSASVFLHCLPSPTPPPQQCIHLHWLTTLHCPQQSCLAIFCCDQTFLKVLPSLMSSAKKKGEPPALTRKALVFNSQGTAPSQISEAWWQADKTLSWWPQWLGRFKSRKWFCWPTECEQPNCAQVVY